MRLTTLARALLLLVGAALAAPVAAQSDAPSTEKMIEQLRVPRTRSLRNLSVESVPAVAATADKPQATVGAAQNSTPVQSPPAAAMEPPSAEASRPSLSLLVQFDFDSARVRPESQQALANLLQALQSAELRTSRFAVEGHTDAKGTVDYNLRLSALRALAVRDFLKARGVAAERLMASGKGASELANGSEPFAAENRRVRIVNLD